MAGNWGKRGCTDRIFLSLFRRNLPRMLTARTCGTSQPMSVCPQTVQMNYCGHKCLTLRPLSDFMSNTVRTVSYRTAFPTVFVLSVLVATFKSKTHRRSQHPTLQNKRRDVPKHCTVQGVRNIMCCGKWPMNLSKEVVHGIACCFVVPTEDPEQPQDPNLQNQRQSMEKSTTKTKYTKSDVVSVSKLKFIAQHLSVPS